MRDRALRSRDAHLWRERHLRGLRLRPIRPGPGAGVYWEVPVQASSGAQGEWSVGKGTTGTTVWSS